MHITAVNCVQFQSCSTSIVHRTVTTYRVSEQKTHVRHCHVDLL